MPDETPTTTTRRGRTLDQRMAWVQRKLEDVPRRGHAEITTRSGGAYSYDYILEADLMAGIRPLLAEAGIAFYYSDEIVSIESGGAHVRVHLTLAAGGETRAFRAEGYATDLGDKHVNKAKTTAVRYWLWKTFLQPSDDDDPEQANVLAVDAAHADDARKRADAIRRGETTRRTERATTGEQSTGQLVQRLTTLANELDEVQALPAGRTLTELMDAIFAEHETMMAQLPSNELVRIGRALADHVTNERAAAERDGATYTPTAFTLPRGE